VGLNYWLLAGGFVSLVEIVPVIGLLVGAIFVVAIALPQSLHTAVLSLVVLVGVREFQSYVVNPHLMGRSVGLSPLVTLVSVSVVSILFGGFAVVLAVPFTSAVATLIDVFVLDHDAPERTSQQRRRLRPDRASS
jgi:predicted PurR-regulated permease PerM